MTGGLVGDARKRLADNTWRGLLDATLTPAGGNAPGDATTPPVVPVERDAREDVTPPAGPLTGYFIAPDGDDEPTLWRGHPDDERPMPVLNQHELRHDPAVWSALVALIQNGARP